MDEELMNELAIAAGLKASRFTKAEQELIRAMRSLLQPRFPDLRDEELLEIADET